jgi:hypothetical protein
MDKKKVWHVSLERQARLKGVKQTSQVCACIVKITCLTLLLSFFV